MRSTRLFYAVAAFALTASISAAIGEPAVSGANGKLSLEGGSLDGAGTGIALGSLTLPVGTSFGMQFDGAVGLVDDQTLGGGGFHFFTRDPSQYLLGVYGSYHALDDISIWRLAGEAEAYFGRVSIKGFGGYENVDFPSTYNGALVLNGDEGHFFGRLDLAYYPTENLKLSAGYHYESEINLGSVSAEYLLPGVGAPVSVFAKGDFGEDSYSYVSGGLKVYFGAEQNKSLIKRHRTEDPDNYLPVFQKIVTQSKGADEGEGGVADPPQCQVDSSQAVTSPTDGNCICPTGTMFGGENPWNNAGTYRCGGSG